MYLGLIVPAASRSFSNTSCTGLHEGGICKPTGIVGEACAVEESAAQPDENDGQMAEMS